MDKEYYLRYYDFERTHWWFKARNKIIVSLLEKHISDTKLNILNIGAATGYTSQLLEKFGNVISIEYDEATCILTKEKLNIDIRHGSALDLEFEDQYFDMVCAFDVIEHIKEDQTAVKEITRVCKSGGIIFITVPAFNFLWSEHDEINHHERRYTIQMLKQQFKTMNTHYTYMSYFNHFLFIPIAITRILQKIFTFKQKPRKLKSDFERFNKNSIFNKVLFLVFYSEKTLIRIGLKLPFGVSLMSLIRKV